MPAAALPTGPDPFDNALAAVRSFLFGGNTVVRVGILVLLVGVTLLLKYAAEHALFPIELRMASAALLGMVLVGVGLRLRERRPGFARTLQGGGVAALYLVVFFSFRTYGLLPGGLAFALLAVIAAASALLAVLQNALALVVIGQIGGFLAPILASTGGGSHVALFSYYLVLNLAIFGIAWVRAWRPLNLIGFLFTFGIGTAWGALRYEPEHLWTTEPFLIAFFLLYLAIPVLFALRHERQGLVDGGLFFGTPLAFLGLQLALLRHIPFAMAYTSLALGLVYFGLARLLRRRAPEALGTMIESALALSVGFGTLAVPYGLSNAGLTGATWAIEGAGLYFVGVRQQRWLARLCAVVLQGMAGVALLAHLAKGYPADALPLVNTRTLGAALLCLGSLFIARHSHKHRAALPGFEPELLQGLIGWGLLFFLPAALQEVEEHAPAGLRPGLFIAVLPLVFGALELAGRALDWRAARYPNAALVPLWLPLALFWHDAESSHLLGSGGFIGWPLYAIAVLLCLRRFVPEAPPLFRYLHPIAFVSAAGFAALELARATRQLAALPTDWSAAAFGMAGVAALAAVLVRGLQARWPLAEYGALYRGLGGAALALALFVWSLTANVEVEGSSEPLAYLPVLNPIELAQLLAFAAVFAWYRSERARPEPALHAGLLAGMPAALGALGFVFWNALLARCVHHFAGVPWDPDALWRSSPLQMACSISWTLIALGVTVLASRSGRRTLWFTGAALLGVVVVKLFTVDLSRLSTLAKIGTFLAVGLLLLLVGYLSPVPGSGEPRAPAKPPRPQDPESPSPNPPAAPEAPRAEPPHETPP